MRTHRPAYLGKVPIPCSLKHAWIYTVSQSSPEEAVSQRTEYRSMISSDPGAQSPSLALSPGAPSSKHLAPCSLELPFLLAHVLLL
jgi:hypothetical protein